MVPKSKQKQKTKNQEKPKNKKQNKPERQRFCLESKISRFSDSWETVFAMVAKICISFVSFLKKQQQKNPKPIYSLI